MGFHYAPFAGVALIIRSAIGEEHKECYSHPKVSNFKTVPYNSFFFADRIVTLIEIALSLLLGLLILSIPSFPGTLFWLLKLL